jgi:putative flippase GtrA
VPQFARFLLCGGLAALANWSSRFAWSLFFPFSIAVLAAYMTGMIVAFHLFKTFVFPNSDREQNEQVRGFVLVNAVGICVTWLLANLLVTHILPGIGMRSQVEATGHALAILAPVATSWFGHRLFSFR